MARAGWTTATVKPKARAELATRTTFLLAGMFDMFAPVRLMGTEPRYRQIVHLPWREIGS